MIDGIDNDGPFSVEEWQRLFSAIGRMSDIQKHTFMDKLELEANRLCGKEVSLVLAEPKSVRVLGKPPSVVMASEELLE